MRLTIEKLVYGGAGLARTAAGVVFVPRTAPGDVVEAEIAERKKDYATARVIEILEKSPDRQEPTCQAGCCHWQHIRYERQVDYKEQIVRESLRRLGHVDWAGEIRRITGPDRNYRLRATFHVVNGRLGFIEEKTNRVAPIRECASLAPELNEFIASFESSGAREVHAISTPEVYATFVAEDGTMHRTGRATIHVGGVQYKVNPETFFQANRFLLAPFIREVMEQAGPEPGNVLELFAGVGFFSIPLAGAAREVIAIESGRAAARQARENARINGRWQLQVVEGQVDATLKGAELKPDVVVLDPPRAGMKDVELIARLKPGRVVYISCNPTTFAREAAALGAAGYRLSRLTLVDQFPNTYHVELVGLFLAADCSDSTG